MRKSTKHGPIEHRQRSASYQDTAELERLVAAHHEVVVSGGAYVVRVVGTVIPSANIRDFYAWTETHPYVYGDSFGSLQQALDDVHRKYTDALAAKAAAANHSAADRET